MIPVDGNHHQQRSPASRLPAPTLPCLLRRRCYRGLDCKPHFTHAPASGSLLGSAEGCLGPRGARGADRARPGFLLSASSSPCSSSSRRPGSWTRSEFLAYSLSQPTGGSIYLRRSGLLGVFLVGFQPPHTTEVNPLSSAPRVEIPSVLSVFPRPLLTPALRLAGSSCRTRKGMKQGLGPDVGAGDGSHGEAGARGVPGHWRRRAGRKGSVQAD